MALHNTRTCEGINQIIYDSIRNNSNMWDVFHLGTLNKSDQDLVWNFLTSSGFEPMKEHAFPIIQKALEGHGKGKFREILKHATHIEEILQRLIPDLRDHIVHSAYVYLLGVMFIAKLPPISSSVPKELWFALRWKLTSILHDIGNSPHLFSRSLSQYLAQIAPIGGNERDLLPIQHSIRFDGLENLDVRPKRMHNSYTIIQKRLDHWNIQIDIKKEFDSANEQGIVDHGIFSALFIFKIIDTLYTQKNPDHIVRDDELKEIRPDSAGWGREHFDTEIVDAAAAISIHNLAKYLQPKEVDYETAPLAFLLILSDTIQEWDRYSSSRRVYDPNSIRLTFKNEIPKLQLALPIHKIENINETLGKLRIHKEGIIAERMA